MIDEIIKLKEDKGLLEKDFSYEKAREWYGWAFKNGFIETIFEGSELVGFCEWITAREIPKTLNDYPLYPEKGNVLIIGTVIAERPYVMWRLKDKILSKNKNRIATVWHRKRDGKLIVIRRTV